MPIFLILRSRSFFAASPAAPLTCRTHQQQGNGMAYIHRVCATTNAAATLPTCTTTADGSIKLLPPPTPSPSTDASGNANPLTSAAENNNVSTGSSTGQQTAVL
jgi:hypothetical protein